MVSNVAYTLNSVVDFGKYKGKTFMEVLQKDDNYIFWALKEVDLFCLYKEDFDYLMNYVVKNDTYLVLSQHSFAESLGKSISEIKNTEVWYSTCLKLYFRFSSYDYYSIKHKIIPNKIQDTSQILFKCGNTNVTKNDVSSIIDLINEMRDNCEIFLRSNTLNASLLYEETIRFLSLVEDGITPDGKNITTSIV